MAAKDVIERAFRRLGILAIDETPQPHDYAYARGVLVGIINEIQNSQGLTFVLSVDAIPVKYIEPLSLLLAVDLASSYSLPPPSARATAMMRLRAINWPLRQRDWRENIWEPTDYGWEEPSHDTYF